MHNTMNSCKYKSTLKSPFDKINILMLPSILRESIHNIPYILPIFATASHYESNFAYREIITFHDVM